VGVRRVLSRPSPPRTEGELEDPLTGHRVPRLADRGPAAPYPETRESLEALLLGDARPLSALLALLVEDPEHTCHMLPAAMRAVAGDAAAHSALTAWVVAAPGDWRAGVARGLHSLACARPAPRPFLAPPPGRGTGELAWLRHAEADLAAVARAEPDRVEAWLGLLCTGGELRVPVIERTLRYEEVHRRAPFLAPAVFAAVVGLGRRNAGDGGEVLGLARLVLEQVAHGHAALGAVPLAHLEVTAGAPEDRLQEYFGRADVVDALDRAFGRWWDGSSGPLPPSHRIAANAFAAAFTRAARFDEVRACCRRIGELPAPEIWHGFGLPPLDVYQLVRSRLGLLGDPPRVRFLGTVPDPGPPEGATPPG
jgi:hypothetical protein